MSGNGETVGDQMAAAVERAKPYIDAGPRPGWPASRLIIIGYCIIADGRAGDALERAAGYAKDCLTEARNRYAAGFWADPFLEPAQVRS